MSVLESGVSKTGNLFTARALAEKSVDEDYK